VIADDPRLTVRDAGQQETILPLRVVLDSHLRLPPAARMLTEAGRTIVICIDDRRRQELIDAGAEVVRVAESGGRPAWPAVLHALADLEVNDLLVEAGPTLSGSLLASQLVDELVIYQAPHIMGSETRRMADTPAWHALADRMSLKIRDVRRMGADMRITARPAD
jgi:diaminohydroxyphosphoribosylaminopyrimidine deaminase/5-amino-6-(5-phosphoribosylamino)uracil reductase